MTINLFKETLPSIQVTGKSVIHTEEDEKSYVPFIINRALSFHRDCVSMANEMNIRPQTPKLLQYHFLIATIRKWKRPFQKW